MPKSSRWKPLAGRASMIVALAAWPLAAPGEAQAEALFISPWHALPQYGLAFDWRAHAGEATGDGIPDALATHTLEARCFRGTPNGLEPSGVSIPVSGAATGAEAHAVADVDGDGLADLLRISAADQAVHVHWSEGGGAFSPAQSVPLPGTCRSVQAVDVDGDGRLDLLAGRKDAPELLILRGLGGRAFAPASPVAAPAAIEQILGGDVDVDGLTDLVVVALEPLSFFQFPRPYSMHAEGSGGFAPAVKLTTGFVAQWPVLADLDGDGHADVCYTVDFAPEKGMQFRSGQPDGSFAAAIPMPGPWDSAGPSAAGDFDGDGALELVVRGLSLNCARMAWDGSQMAVEPASLDSRLSTDDVAADVDGDGLDDLVGVSVLFSCITVDLSSHAGDFRNQWTDGGDQAVARAADLDGDGRPDLLTLLAGGGGARLRHGLPNGELGPPQTLELLPGPRNTQPADGDLDGDIDLLVAGQEASALAGWAVNDGTGAFGLAPTASVPGSLSAAAFADMDMDGVPDVLLATDAPAALSVLQSLPSLALAVAAAVPLASGATGLDDTDVDGSGWRDIALAGVGGSALVLPLGPAGFGTPLTLSAMGTSHAVTSGDLDADGREDLLVASTSTIPYHTLPHVAWHEADGAGGVTLHSELAFEDWPKLGVLSAEDLDGDGRSEVLAATAGGYHLVLVLSGAGSVLVADDVLITPVDPTSIAVDDLDGDGTRDLVCAGHPQGNAFWIPSAASRWASLGHSLAGAAGLSRLAATGPLLPGTTVNLAIEGAAPGAPFVLFSGLGTAMVPFHGGLLVPLPQVVVVGGTTDVAGQALVQDTYPGGLQPGTLLVVQAWLEDPAGPAGASATNAVAGTVP